MAAIDQKLIDRINVLAKKKKEGTITPEELKEQDKLRKEYIKLFREGFKSQLKAIKVVDEKGNDITPLKLKQEKLVLNVVLDGIVLEENLKILGKDMDWLEKQTKKQGIKNIEKIFLATCDQDDNLSVYMKVNNNNADDMF